MDCVIRKIGKKGLATIFLGFNKVGSFLTEPDGEGFSFRTILQVWVLVGGEKTAPWTTGIEPAFVNFKPMIRRPGALATQMPLARKKSFVAGIPHRFCQGNFGRP